MAITEYWLDLRSTLREVAVEIEIARGPGGRWLGVLTMQPTSITDLDVRYLRAWGVVEVLEWDDEPDGLGVVFDLDAHDGFRVVRALSEPARARLSTDGWAILDS